MEKIYKLCNSCGDKKIPDPDGFICEKCQDALCGACCEFRLEREGAPDHCHCENCNCDKALEEGARVCDLCLDQCSK